MRDLLRCAEEVPEVMTRLDKAANWVTIVAGIVVTCAVAYRFLPAADARGLPAKTSYAVDEPLKTGTQIDYARAAHTLLLTVDPKCGVCTSNMPFFRTLAEQARTSTTRLVVIGKDSVDVLRGYLHEHGLDNVEIATMSLSDLRVRAVPTMLLADDRGRFKKVWIGGLMPEAQAALLSQVKAGWRE